MADAASLRPLDLSGDIRRAHDEDAIRRIVDRWALWRDTGDWDRFETLWHPSGRMEATWFSGSAREFIARGRAAFGKGAAAHHVMGGTAVDVAGDHAVAASRVVLHLRTTVDDVLCDATCLGQFIDLLLRGKDGWQLVLRQPVYEKDRLDPVDPSVGMQLDPALLASFPDSYRYLAYAQARMGLPVRHDLPGVMGPEREALEALRRDWLAGRTAALLPVDNRTDGKPQ